MSRGTRLRAGLAGLALAALAGQGPATAATWTLQNATVGGETLSGSFDFLVATGFSNIAITSASSGFSYTSANISFGSQNVLDLVGPGLFTRLSFTPALSDAGGTVSLFPNSFEQSGAGIATILGDVTTSPANPPDPSGTTVPLPAPAALLLGALGGLGLLRRRRAG